MQVSQFYRPLFTGNESISCNSFLCLPHFTGRSTDEHIDKTIVRDLVFDEDAIAAKQEAKAEKKQRKADQKLRERLKAERKKESTKNEMGDEDEDADNMNTFAKGSRGKAKAR